MAVRGAAKAELEAAQAEEQGAWDSCTDFMSLYTFMQKDREEREERMEKEEKRAEQEAAVHASRDMQIMALMAAIMAPAQASAITQALQREGTE